MQYHMVKTYGEDFIEWKEQEKSKEDTVRKWNNQEKTRNVEVINQVK